MPLMFRAVGLTVIAVSFLCAFAGAEAWKMKGDSLVLAGVTPGNLCYDKVVEGSVVVRSTYEPGQPDTVVYTEGEDYTVDYANGAIARTAGSRIPDFTTNVLYGQKEFDHNQFPGFTNRGFFGLFFLGSLSSSMRRQCQRSAAISHPEDPPGIASSLPFLAMTGWKGVVAPFAYDFFLTELILLGDCAVSCSELSLS